MLLIYSDISGNRWSYITQLLLGNLCGYEFNLTGDRNEFIQFEGPKLNYSHNRITESEIYIQSVSLLQEKDIYAQEINVFDFNGKPAFFGTDPSADLPFDIFSASFLLVSRYEEYLPHEKDEYGRYSHKQSIAFKHHFLNRPLVNEWMIDLKKLIHSKFPGLLSRDLVFRFMPTYDIDIAFSYLHKGWKRNFLGILSSLSQFNFKAVSDRLKVLYGSKADPYDVYEWLYALHLKYGLRPHYFFLVAEKIMKYDRNIHPSVKAMQELIRFHSMGYPIGIHPSWQSGDNGSLIKKEKAVLEEICGKEIFSGRQHYIRFTLPVTYRSLIKEGITSDFSMGYGTINGFRASVSTPFRWFDLEENCATPLVIYPFCFMDANSFYEQKLTPAQAYQEIKYYHDIIKKVKGTMITIWHNPFFGSSPVFKGWKEVYELFLEEVVYWDL